METEEKKYELTDETVEIDGHVLHRIRAVKGFSNEYVDVAAGDLGGYIEDESNLSHNGTCWVAGEAKVFNGSIIKDDAHILGNSTVSNSTVCGTAGVINSHVWDAVISDDVAVWGGATIDGRSIGHFTGRGVELSNRVRVHGHVVIRGWVRMWGDVRVYGKARIFTDEPSGCVIIYGGARIHEHARVSGRTVLSGDINVHGYAHIHGPCDRVDRGDALRICGNEFSGYMDIQSHMDYLVVSPPNLTFARTRNRYDIEVIHRMMTIKHRGRRDRIGPRTSIISTDPYLTSLEYFEERLGDDKRYKQIICFIKRYFDVADQNTAG